MLYYKATAGCGVGMFVGVSARKRAAPVTLILGRVAALARCRPHPRPSSLLRHPLHTHRSHPYALLRRPAPPLILLHVPYPCSPHLARPSSVGRQVVPSRFLFPSPRSSFIPCLHNSHMTVPRNSVSRPVRRWWCCCAGILSTCVAAVVVFLAAAWRVLLSFLLLLACRHVILHFHVHV